MRFEQMKPAGGRLVAGDTRAGQLVYETPAGEQVEVPNVWYNQPVEWRIRALRTEATWKRERAAYWQEQLAANPDRPDWRHFAAAAIESAQRLDALADEMERTGKVLC